jgi:hypothetical protein
VSTNLSDDVDILGRTVIEGNLVHGFEAALLAAIEANAKLNLRDSAFAKVTDGARGRGDSDCSNRSGG